MTKPRILLDRKTGYPRLVPGHPFTPRDIERFQSRFKVAGPDECWECRGYPVNGYVQIRLGPNRRLQQSNRISHQLYLGEIPDGLMALHTCDNRRCVNPRHLYAGDSLDNARDREARGRGNQPKGSNNWYSKLTEEQVREIHRRYVKGKAGGDIRHRLAEEFGVLVGTVQKIAYERTWRHLWGK